MIGKLGFWWIMSTLPWIVVVSIVNAFGPISQIWVSLFTNIAIWSGWLLFVGGLRYSRKREYANKNKTNDV